MNFAKMALKTAALALSATVLLTACGESEESNDDQPSDASDVFGDTTVSGTASSENGDGGDGSELPINVVEQRLSLGYGHSAVIAEDGSLYMWGGNEFGQLGNGTEQYSSTPIKIMDHVASVSLGADHSAAITEDGSLYLWGDNRYGQLGSGESGKKTCKTTPIKIMDRVRSVSLGISHSAAITEDGSLYLWGDNEYGQLGNGKKGVKQSSNEPIKIMDHVKSVSLGSYFSAAITEDGSLYTWGRNGCGQLGNGESGYDISTKEQLFSSTPVKVMDHVKMVSLGNLHSAAITEDDSLYLWGNSACGKLGTGEEHDINTPNKIMDHVKAVSLRLDHSGAITEDGSLYMWGRNDDGQLGIGTNQHHGFTITKIMDHVEMICLGNTYSGAITEDGSLYMWGMDYGNEPQLFELFPQTENQ